MSLELITNGNFDTDDAWTFGGDWIWDGGANLRAIMVGTAQSGTLSQSIRIEAGFTYEVGYYYSGDGVISGALGGTAFEVTAGTNTVQVTAGSSNTLIEFIGQCITLDTLRIDSVSVQLVIPATAVIIDDQTEGLVTLKFAVPLGHAHGDYAQIYSNNGAGDIDWDTPFSTQQIPLYPGGAGWRGFGEGGFGTAPFGGPAPNRIRRGFGTSPFGMSPFGLGCVMITKNLRITECGHWLFAVKCFDALGNAHTGAPNQATAVLHVNPPRPQRLILENYDPVTDVLTLNVYDPYDKDNYDPDFVPLSYDLTGTPFEGFEGEITGPGGTRASGTTDPGFPNIV